MRSTGESFRIPIQRSVVSPKRKLPHSPCPHCRLTEPRSGPFRDSASLNWDRFRGTDSNRSLTTFQAVFWASAPPDGTVPLSLTSLCAKRTRNTREVVPRRGDCKPPGCKQLGDGALLLGADFNHQMRSALHEARRIGCDGTISR